MAKDASPVIWFEELRRNDVPRVGGKNASLGEMVRNLEKRGVVSNQLRSIRWPWSIMTLSKNEDAKRTIETLSRGYTDKTEYFVDRPARGLARIAAAHHPKRVIVRMSDFKANEYANLIGGAFFEPKEENPMLGFRGASRYYSPRYRDGVALECHAIRRLREKMGFLNVTVMIPFCRSTSEADRVLVMAENGLVRGRNGLEVFVMCEIPSNVILAMAFARRTRRGSEMDGQKASFTMRRKRALRSVYAVSRRAIMPNSQNSLSHAASIRYPSALTASLL